jgi:murein DD-endopeptidase MepM/ murein hydrolase activator NlpD
MSSSYYPSTEPAPRRAPAHPKSAATVSRQLHRTNDGYTLAHGGRQVRIGPVAFWIVVGTLVAMAVWSVATGTYFAFREDVLTRLIAREASMRLGYEDRVADLRAEIDRITSRQLLDQDQFEKKLEALVSRQATLERRTSALADDEFTTGSIPHLRKGGRSHHARKAVKDSMLMLPGQGAGLNGTLQRVSTSLDKVEGQQTAYLTGLEQHVDSKARRMRDVLDDLGVSATALKPSRHADIGGPFVPLRLPRRGASDFDRQLYRVNLARAQIDRYHRALSAVPVRKPLAGELDMTSPFGVRTDPFVGRPAMHTGMDLRGEVGEPVHVTADGKVTIAGWDGGYGRMVEVNHGNGLATRYGHLSKIEVKIGQTVHRGQEIGRVGSTGRATGPHLHYETRIHGEPVDPRKFLHAGTELAGL